MLYHVLTLDKKLSDGAFRVYALLLKYARQGDGCWPGIERLATDLGKGERSIKRLLAELESRGLITRERRYGRSSLTWLEDLEAVYGKQPDDRAKNGPIEQSFEGAKNGPIDRAKNGPTEEKAENKKHTTTALSVAAQKALDLLLTVPRMDPATARWLVTACDLAEVAGWVAEGQKADPSLAAPLVVARLKSGEKAPAHAVPEEPDRRRYISGPNADLIQH